MDGPGVNLIRAALCKAHHWPPTCGNNRQEDIVYIIELAKLVLTLNSFQGYILRQDKGQQWEHEWNLAMQHELVHWDVGEQNSVEQTPDTLNTSYFNSRFIGDVLVCGFMERIHIEVHWAYE